MTEGRLPSTARAERERLTGFLRYMEWADARTWKSVRVIPGAQQDERLLTLLHHLHLVQWIYVALWRSEMPVITQASSYGTLDAVEQWARPCYAQAISFAESLNAEDLERVVDFPWAADIEKQFGFSGPITLRETIAQVLLHTTYHRGQVATRVRELGGDPALTDYIAWIWMNRPPAEW